MSDFINDVKFTARKHPILTAVVVGYFVILGLTTLASTTTAFLKDVGILGGR